MDKKGSMIVKKSSIFNKGGGHLLLERQKKSKFHIENVSCVYPVEVNIKNRKITSYFADIQLTVAEKKQILNAWDDAVNYD